MWSLILPGLLGLTLPEPDPAPVPPDTLDWMAGHWRTQEGDRISEEFWTAGLGGLQLGANRMVVGDSAVSFEYLRIEQTGTGRQYCAAPGGGAETCFALAATGTGWARFENPGHDFPQAIEYRLDGTTLTATISALDGQNAMSWHWERVVP